MKTVDPILEQQAKIKLSSEIYDRIYTDYKDEKYYVVLADHILVDEIAKIKQSIIKLEFYKPLVTLYTNISLLIGIYFIPLIYWLILLVVSYLIKTEIFSRNLYILKVRKELLQSILKDYYAVEASEDR